MSTHSMSTSSKRMWFSARRSTCICSRRCVASLFSSLNLLSLSLSLRLSPLFWFWHCDAHLCRFVLFPLSSSIASGSCRFTRTRAVTHERKGHKSAEKQTHADMKRRYTYNSQRHGPTRSVHHRTQTHSSHIHSAL